MKLIKKENVFDTICYFYKNGIIKKVSTVGTVYWFKQGYLYKYNGAATQNCYNCIKNKCFSYKNPNNKYKRHFYLNDIYFNFSSYLSNDCELLPYNFAIKTNHKICNVCEDFCNQKCFLEENEINKRNKN